MKNYETEVPADKERASSPALEMPVIDVADLMGVHREILLKFDEDTYRLRITSKGKLIMTK